MWKHLTHPNVVPLLGITSSPLQLVSEWMPGGGLTEYVKRNPKADRLELVGVSRLFIPPRSSLTSCPMSLTASTISTPTT